MTTIDYSIKDVEKVVNLEGKVKNVEVSRLTAPGENFMSLVLQVDFEIEENDNSKIVSTVAKRLPLKIKEDELEMHGHAMNNEIKWYSEIVPLLKSFAKENDIEMDFYPQYHGSRYSLDPSKEKPDSDSVLILENLIPEGYQNVDRYIGFDLTTSKMILKDLALFHALPIAIKERKEKSFQIIKDFLDKCIRKMPPRPPSEAKKPEDMLLEALANIPDIAPHLSKIKALFDKFATNIELYRKITKEPWNTTTHNDFWVNNIMVNFNEGQEPLIKIVDFQMCLYGSYAKDVVFFLLSSVRNDVTQESMDDLLRFYYDEFTSILRKTNVNLVLTYEDYLEEIRTAAEVQVCHAIFFSTIIFGEKGTAKDSAVEEFEPLKQLADMLNKMSQLQKDKLIIIVSEAIKRNWM